MIAGEAHAMWSHGLWNKVDHHGSVDNDLRL